MRLLYLVVGLCVVLGIAAWGFLFRNIDSAGIGFPRSYSIPSTSMEPTVRRGELIFATVGFYRDHRPEMGDIVIFEGPEGDAFIKRVVAGPGDRVRLDAGRLYINGVIVDRVPLPDFVSPEDGRPVPRYRETFPNGRTYEILEAQGDLGQLDTMADVTIPEGQYFMLGDNRDSSSDSRLPELGTIALDRIFDRPAIVWFSTDLSRIGTNVQPTD